MGRSTPNASASTTFTDAVEATGNLFNEAFLKLHSSAEIRGLAAHSEIRNVSVASKSAVFFRHYLPLREQMISLLSDTYRRFLKLALANSSQIRVRPEQWAWIQLQPAIQAALQWIREWYILACEGENQNIRVLTTMQVVQSGEITEKIPNSVPELQPWFASIMVISNLFRVVRYWHDEARTCSQKGVRGETGEIAHSLVIKGS